MKRPSSVQMGHVVHARGDQHLLIGAPHPLADDGNVVGGLLRAVGTPTPPDRLMKVM